MTKEELDALLEGRDLLGALDVKTLVLDTVKKMDETEILDIFWAKLPELTPAEIKGYFYMRRG